LKFWDSSALVPLLVDEAMSPAMKSLAFADSEKTVWWGTPVECVSALTRRLRMQQISQAAYATSMVRLDDARHNWLEVPPSEKLRIDSERLLTAHPLSAADALQLAAALHADGGNPAPPTFVCLDDRLRQAARSEGFIVEP
jgi:predicted nucleic acid-binding protein